MITTLTKKNSLAGLKGYVDTPGVGMVVKDGRTILVDKIENSKVIIRGGTSLQFIYFGIEPDEFSKLEFVLDGEGSSLSFLGFVVGKGRNTFNFEVEVRHSSPQTKAAVSLYSALFEKSKVDFKGNLIIEKNAQLADTYLTHKTLLLSDESRVRTIPALEIMADDVKAGHAATIGKVNKQDLFYLLSRGIERTAAEHLLITGFFEDQLQLIEDQDLRNSLRQAIIKSLPFYKPDFMR